MLDNSQEAYSPHRDESRNCSRLFISLTHKNVNSEYIFYKLTDVSSHFPGYSMRQHFKFKMAVTYLAFYSHWGIYFSQNTIVKSYISDRKLFMVYTSNLSIYDAPQHQSITVQYLQKLYNDMR